MEHLVNAFEIHNRINLFFIDSLTLEQWGAKAAKGKSVASQFAHLHTVRLMWLKSAAPDLLSGLPTLAENPTQEAVREALSASSQAVATLLQGLEPGGKVKGFKPHAAGFVGYLISHESHHRGQAELTLRLVGTPISDKVSYGLWEWGVR